MLGRSQNGVPGVDAVDRRAARARIALVAGRVEHPEVRTAHALQQVAADRSHVAQLRRRAFDQRLRDQRLQTQRIRMRGNFRHPRQGPDQQVGALGVNAAEGQRIDVDQPLGTLNFLAHQVDQRRAAGDISAAASGRVDRAPDGVHLFQAERDHGQRSRAAAAMAATMPG
jgi:hypothetical protein